jgi:tetratricopeptide (TPR) repeat protein
VDFLEELRQLARQASQGEDWHSALNMSEMLRNCFLDASEIFIGRGMHCKHSAGWSKLKRLLPKQERSFRTMSRPRPAMLASQKSAAIGRRPFAVGRTWQIRFQIFTSPKVIFCKTWQSRRRGAIFRAAIHRFPNDEWAAVRYTGIAVLKRDWIEALRRWGALRARFPDQLIGVLGQAEALRELGRVADADVVLTEATEKFPPDEWLAISLARTAMAGGDWEEALRRWETAIKNFPRNSSAYVGKAETLSNLGRFDEAEAVLRLAANRFPRDALLIQTQTTLALRQHNWDEAISHWTRGRDLIPSCMRPILCGMNASSNWMTGCGSRR